MGKYSNQVKTNEAWLPMIPSQWKLKKIKWSFKERSEKGYPDEPLLVASQNMGVVPKNVYGKRTVEALKDLDKLKLVKIGDYVVSLRSFQGGIEYAYYQGIISPAYTIMRPNLDFCSAYYKFLFKSAPFIKLLTTCVTGIREGQNIDYGKLKNHYIPVPPRAEQDQIVRFLDWKVSEINKLISIKRCQISLLDEAMERKISDVIIHGLSANVPLKESGTKWIGALPANWQVIRCKYLFKERNQRSETGEEQHLSMSQKYGLIPDRMLDEHRMLSASYKGGKICYKDDLVLNRLKAHLGVFALAPQFGVISPDYTVLVPNTEKILPVFAETVLKSRRCRRELQIRVRGIIEGFWRLYTDDFYTIVIPVPSLDEQRDIMDYISSTEKRISNYVDTIKKEINVLKELKTRIISDVVTGKIDVRNIPVPAYEHVEDMGDDAGEGNEENVGISGEED